MTPRVGDEVVAVYRDPSSIIKDIPELAYGRLGVVLDPSGHATGIAVETGGGATFIDADDLIRVQAVEEQQS